MDHIKLEMKSEIQKGIRVANVKKKVSHKLKDMYEIELKKAYAR